MALNCFGLTRIIILWETIAAISSYQMEKVFRIGDDLQLSCPQDNSNQTWWFNGISLDNNTIHSNGITLLQISNVSQKNEGIYWCGLSWQQGMNETVLVGDPPSAPRQLYTTSIEFNKILHFIASDSTGGLPTYYSVHIHCISPPNCSHSKKDSLYVPEILDGCDSTEHIDGKHYQCNLESVNLFVKYNATVYAINPLGNSSASITFTRPNMIDPDTTPAKPLQLKATEIQSDKVRLTWKSHLKDNMGTYYRIVYGGGESTNINKTWPKDVVGTDTSVVIDNLKANTKYTFYVLRQFRTSDKSSPFSPPAVTSLQTPYAAPDEPPQNVKCPQVEDSSSNYSTVLLSWKAPSKGHRNGPLVFYKIFYGTSRDPNRTVKFVNASQTNINLTFLALHKTISIYLTVCTKQGLCSGISETCKVEARHPYSTKMKLPEANNEIPIILGVVSAVVIIAFILICIIIIRKAHQNRNTSELDIIIPIDDRNYTTDYSEPEDNEDEDKYDTPLV